MKHQKADTSVSVPQRGKIKFDLHIREFPWSAKQLEFIELAQNKETKFIFLHGPAGSAKTLLAVYCALNKLQHKVHSDIVYVRQPVESSKHNIGYLKGDIQEKLTPYAQPLEDKLNELLSPTDVKRLAEDNRIVCAPIGHMRGRTFNAQSVIVDECFPENTTILLEVGSATIKTLFDTQNSGKPLPNVVSFNEGSGIFEPKTIVNVVSKGVRPLISLKLGNRKIKCTPEHPILTHEGWKQAHELQKGDAVVAYDTANTHQVIRALNSDQKQLVLGSYLGDGSIAFCGEGRARVRIIHGMRQQNYCKWKAAMFNAEANIIEANGFSKKPAIRFSSKVFSTKSIGMDVAMNDKKSCHQSVLDHLDARGLAIWVMDDGSVSPQGNYATLHTESFDYSSQCRFVEFFKKMGISPKIVVDEGVGYKYYYLKFNKKDTQTLINVIAPYIHEDLLYKIGGVRRAQDEVYEWCEKFLSHSYIVFDKWENASSQEVFDIEVADNHNFIVSSRSKQRSGVVVHNCQNLAFEDFLLIMTRLGRKSKMILSGDVMQPDIRNSAFQQVSSLFEDEEAKARGIHVFRFGKEDIFRDESLAFVIERFESWDKSV